MKKFLNGLLPKAIPPPPPSPRMGGKKKEEGVLDKKAFSFAKCVFPLISL